MKNGNFYEILYKGYVCFMSLLKLCRIDIIEQISRNIFNKLKKGDETSK